ncbi:MFS transporter [Streptantibioticus silvisoli]|uniref:MFS transporter n=1 Tax=Streptantibioticus silvisoli TaxID=2705255 RepID=UPI003556B2C6
MSDRLKEDRVSALPRALLRERARPDRIREQPGAWRPAVLTVCFGAFMGQLDASVVTLTYGGLRTGFHASLAAVEWVSLSYLLALVALLVPVGRLSDTHGRKLFYLHGFAVFSLASAACGLAPALGALIAFRVVQAVGAAMMQANSVALVATCAPPGRLRGALGVQAAAQALGLALGPTVGGLLVSTLGWRWVFLVNVPVGAVAWIAGRYLLPRTRARGRGGPLDTPGILLLSAATGAALLALSAASGLPVPGWGVAALAAAAVAAGRGFAVRQRRAAHPLLDLTLLRLPPVGLGLLGALCGYLVLFGPLVLVPQAVTAAGGSALTAGTVLTALPAGFALAATCADHVLPRRLSDRARCLLGAVVMTAGCAALTAVLLTVLTGLPGGGLPGAGGAGAAGAAGAGAVGAGAAGAAGAAGGAGVSGIAIGLLAGALGLLGSGLGVFTPANNTLVMAAFPVGRSGTGGGLVNMARGLGTALGVALVALALHLASPAGAAAALLAVAVAALAPAVRAGALKS